MESPDPAPRRTRNQVRPARQGVPEPIAALNRVHILEHAHPWPEHEPLVDIRLACPTLVIAEKCCPYLRQEVAAMLNQAQATLPAGYQFKVESALRTLAMQRAGWDDYYRKMQVAHPEWPLSALRRATNRYFAPYDQKAPPGHCTGGAVDVFLIDAQGKRLDVTSPTQGWEGAYTWTDRISPEARANRMILVEAMLGAGFSNCRDEFWHYSYGDSAWAVRVGETECPYGWAHPPVVLANDFEGASATDLHIETFRSVSGRPTHAEGSCALPLGSDSAPRLRVGLYWANGVPIILRLQWPCEELPALCLEQNPQTSTPLTEIEREGETLLLRFTPHTDCVFLVTETPLP